MVSAERPAGRAITTLRRSRRRTRALTALVLAVPFGIGIGLLLGLVGGGGSMLAVPALVYVFGEPVKVATSESLLVVASAALVGALDHARAGQIRVKTALTFGLAGSAGSIAGTALNRKVDAAAILLGFAVLLVAVAGGMLGWVPESHPHARTISVWRVVPVGIGTGVLTGFFGVGGGFAVAPALSLLLRIPLTLAVGTSLLVIAITSSTAFAAHLASGSIHWELALTFAAAAVGGALGGRRLGVRIGSRQIANAFAAMLIAVAVLLVVENAGSL